MKRLLNRPTNAQDINDVNRELEKIYELINELSLSVNLYDDSKSNKGKEGDIRISKNSSGNVVLEIRANDDWDVSTEIFTRLKP